MKFDMAEMEQTVNDMKMQLQEKDKVCVACCLLCLSAENQFNSSIQFNKLCIQLIAVKWDKTVIYDVLSYVGVHI